MKKLKIQKALLAICLALPITLNMTNETNAMKAKEDTNLQIPNNNDPTQQTDTNKAFTFQFWKYLTELPKQTQIKREQYAKFFNDYIQNDKAKFMAVKLISLYKQYITDNNPELTELIDPTIIYQTLVEDVQGTQISEIKQLLDDINEKVDKTNEEKLILLIWAPGRLGLRNASETLDKINIAHSNYNKEEINKEDRNNTTHQSFSSLLDSINQLVQLDYHYQTQLSAKPKPILKKLVNLVQNFTNAYKRKHNQPQEPPQQQNNKVQQKTDESDNKTAQTNVEQGLTAQIITNLTNATEKLSKIIKILLP